MNPALNSALARSLPIALAAVAALLPVSAAAQPSYIGINARANANVLDAASAFPGVTVTEVVENSPGEAAGVKVGDILLTANGTELHAPQQLTALAETLAPGAAVELKAERDQKQVDLKLVTVARVTPPEMPEPAERPTWVENRRLGARLADANPAAGNGIEVIALAERGPLARAKVKPGEVLAEANGEPLHGAEDFIKALAEQPEGAALDLRVVNAEGKSRRERVRLFEPPRETRKISIPLLYKYERSPNARSWSIPLLLTGREQLAGAAKWRILWLIRFETGASEELLEVP